LRTRDVRLDDTLSVPAVKRPRGSTWPYLCRRGRQRKRCRSS